MKRMKRKILLLSLLSIGLFIGGCGTLNEQADVSSTNNAGNTTTNTTTNTTSTPADDANGNKDTASKPGQSQAKNGNELPEFPWPPSASTFTPIPSSYILNPNGQNSLRSVGDKLREAFGKAGYEQTGYYRVPGGFALVSQLEQFKADGTSVEGPDRFSWKVALPRVFSREYFSSLIKGRVGHYRLIVFVVTDQLFIPTGKPIDPDKVPEARGGASDIGQRTGDLPYTNAYTCTALIYEFEKASPSSAAQFKAKSELSPGTHLQKILNNLKR